MMTCRNRAFRPHICLSCNFRERTDCHSKDRAKVEAMSDFWGQETSNKALLQLLLPLVTVALLIQRFLLPLLSNWLALLIFSFTVFQVTPYPFSLLQPAGIICECMRRREKQLFECQRPTNPWGNAHVRRQYGRNKRNLLIEDLNDRWKRQVLYASPKTPLEPCEWLNELMASLWPQYMEQKLSHMLSIIMMKRLKEKRPHPFRSIELQGFFLGVASPVVGMQRTERSSEWDEQAFHMGFEWETKEMKVLLVAKLAGPFKGTARFVINSLRIKGDLRVVPILDGQALVYSFTSCPELRIGMAYGGGQANPVTELPTIIASWLEKLFIDTLMRTMVEPQRRCFPLSAVSLKKQAGGGVLCITTISAKNLNHTGNSKRPLSERLSSVGSGSTLERSLEPGAFFVEVTVEGLTRSTHISEQSRSPRWNDTFNMILHDNAGTVRFDLYEQGSSTVKYDFYGSCEVKVRYAEDGSTIFWTTGLRDQVLADRAESCGKEVLMEVPIYTKGDAMLFVGFMMKEWQFTDGSRSGGDALNGYLSNRLQSLPSLEARTGRTLRITVMEGRNLAAKDRTGKSDPYVQLRYGKVQCKTKMVKQNLDPRWNQSYEFPELGNIGHLQLKCFDADYLNDESLGSARVNLEGLDDRVIRDVWIPLEKIGTGEIRLLIEAFTSEPNSETSQNERQELSMDSERGVLEVVVLEARDLVAADFGGTSDPFVVLYYGDEKQTTKVIHKTLNPHWNQRFEMRDTGKPLNISVRDYNAVLPDVNIGRCVVEYERLPKYQVVDKWIPLQGVRKGEVHVQLIRRPVKQNILPEVLKKCRQVKDLLKQASISAAAGDTDAVGRNLEDIESFEAEKATCLLKLLRDKDLLLAKVEDLGQALRATSSLSDYP